MKVGWFLHTPFPSGKLSHATVREELLLSVLSADLVGFHTYDYARHFVSACSGSLDSKVREGVEDVEISQEWRRFPSESTPVDLRTGRARSVAHP